MAAKEEQEVVLLALVGRVPTNLVALGKAALPEESAFLVSYDLSRLVVVLRVDRFDLLLDDLIEKRSAK